MVRFTRQRLMRHLPLIGGGAAALLAGLFFVVLPDWRLEGAVSASGLPRLLSFAEPPLGLTARLMLAGVAAVLAGAIGWSALFLVWGPGGWLHHAGPSDMPAVRRADAHPDAPPRRPMSAAELGVPPPPSVRPIPQDLNQPLAEFHPAAIPAVPLEPAACVAPLVRVPEPEVAHTHSVEQDMVVEPAPEPEARPEPEPKPEAQPAPEMTRIETFELTPMVRPAPRAPRTEETVEALLERLERVAQARTGRAA